MVPSSKIKVSPKPRKSGAGVDFSLILRSLWAHGVLFGMPSARIGLYFAHRGFDWNFHDFGYQNGGFVCPGSNEGKPTSRPGWPRARKRLRYFASWNLIPNMYLVPEFSWIFKEFQGFWGFRPSWEKGPVVPEALARERD